jgi:hypothetical protein
MGEAAKEESCQGRLRAHMLAHLICPGRHTISSLITVFGQQYQDWTAHYSLYAEDRVKPEAIFRQVRKEVEALGDPRRPLCVAIDDTILRKRGRHIPGTGFRKDPLGPPFHLNLVWAHRELQMSAAVSDERQEVRMIPIAFRDASTPRKPRAGAPQKEWTAHAEQMRQRNLNTLATDLLHELQRERTPESGEPRPLHVVVDGSYTNRKVLRNLPPETVLIGRIRKDAKLFKKPPPTGERGRPRVYGSRIPTPEEIRLDPEIPWQRVNVRVCGKKRQFDIKTLDPVRWPAAGRQDLRLVVIRPVGFRPKKGAHIRYTQPAYLICTDVNLPIEQLLQEYVWRWDIEVNHRDEKTILGVGQAQVRNPNSVQLAPACAVASYAMLLVAAIHAFGLGGFPNTIAPPKWRNPKKKRRPSTLDLINALRHELWADAIKPDILDHFTDAARSNTKPILIEPNLASAIFAATA